jgi:poly(3-hydroxybutyrate) depolymerase
VPEDEHFYYMQPGVGHYGVFNGTRWRTEIQPRVRQMIRSVEQRRAGKGPKTIEAPVDGSGSAKPAGVRDFTVINGSKSVSAAE